ncbi:MAG TPA: serine/threonine-protein kinase [Pirellulaceae bacterium]|nr:serine/threonine-protein kinase [Pirellulaceae bacterium]
MTEPRSKEESTTDDAFRSPSKPTFARLSPSPDSDVIDSDTWSRRCVAGLSEDDRRRFERACDQGETELRGGAALEQVAERVDVSEPIRTLVLLDLAKCAVESMAREARDARVAEILKTLPSLSGNEGARKELVGFADGSGDRSDDTESPVLPPTHELVKRLPSPGLSKLYVARRTKLNRLECLKLVNLAEISHRELAARIADEAERASKLSHPGLVQIFDAGEIAGHCFIAMEYMNGGSLADRISAGPLPWEDAIRIIATAARALDALHTKARLAHGDIKPANLLFTRTIEGEELIKIADFGLSSELVEQARATSGESRGYVFGTAGYVAPELLSSEARDSTVLPFDDRVTADIFALGVTAYEAISGRLPFQTGRATDPLGVLKHPFRPLTELVPGVPNVVGYAIRRACSVDRRERYLSAKEFARALEGCLANRGSGAVTSEVARNEPTMSIDPEAKSSKRFGHRQPIVIISAIVATAICAAIGSAVFSSRSRIETSSQDSAELPNEFSDLRRTSPAVVSRPELTSDSSDLKRLMSRGLSRDSAEAVLEVNNDFLVALRGSSGSSSAAETVLNLLSEVDESRIGSETIVANPQIASFAVYSGIESLPAFLHAVAHPDEDEHCVTNLCIRHPDSATVASSAILWLRRIAPLRALQRQGLYGADEALLHASGVPEYEAWVERILVERIDRDPGRTLQWLTIYLETHDAIRARLEDRAFAASFPRTWERFVALVDRDARTAEDFAINGDAWNVLAMEQGDRLIDRLGLLAAPIFAGSEALPADPELRRLAAEYLLVGYRPIVEALSDADLRRNGDFLELLRKRLPAEVLAEVCRQINAETAAGTGPATAARLAGLGRDQIVADLSGEDLNRWAAEDLVPQLIYLRLGLKLVTGDSLFGVERQALLKQIVIDVVTQGVPIAASRLGLPVDQANAFAQHFPIGYEIGENAVKDAIRRERLDALVTIDSAPETLDDSRRLQTELHDHLREIVSAVTSQRGDVVLDITDSMRLCEGLSIRDERVRGASTIRIARFLRLADGRLFPGVITKDGIFAEETVKQFFDDRWMTLTSKSADGRSKEEAWRELVSAWVLLGAGGLLPATSTTTVEP